MGKIFIPFMMVMLLSGCMTAAQHRDSVQDDSADRVTVGTVQREITVGMSGADVAEILGSPNIVSTDAERREVWIYDKISTDATYSKSSSGLVALILIGEMESGSNSKSQKTLTIIIKFDLDKKVRDFAYHTSRF
jgi:outer membrane protein assembly factor BamE (lipoprotein component of BamABCDE complex)